MDTPEDIAIIVDIHEKLLTGWQENENSRNIASNYSIEIAPSVTEYYFRLDFFYEMADGRTVQRYYTVAGSSEIAKTLVPYFSDPEVVLGPMVNDLDTFVQSIHSIDVYGNNEVYVTKAEDIRDLLEAIMKDCEANTMAQEWGLHPNDEIQYNLHISFHDPEEYGLPYITYSVHVYPGCQATIAWLMLHGATPSDYSK